LGLLEQPKEIKTIDELFSKELLEEDEEEIQELNPA